MRYILTDNLDKEIEASDGNLQSAFNVGRINRISGNYQLLLSTETQLRKHHIEKIKAMGIRQFCIKDELTDDIDIVEPIGDETVLDFEKYFKRIQGKIFPIYEELREKYIDNSSFTANYRAKIHTFMCRNSNPFRLTKMMKEIFDEFTEKFQDEPLWNFVKPIHCHNFVANHGILSGLLGAKMQYRLGASKESMWNLLAGASLQDIAVAPKYYIAKGTDAETEKVFKEHPKLGLMIINETPSWNPLMGIVALNHHRYINRSGFPRSLKVRKLYDYERGMHINGKIGSLVNTYCALSLFYPGHSVLRAITSIFNDFLFDNELTALFENFIDPYPQGTFLELTSGEKGIVKKEKNDSSFILRVIYDEKGRKIKKKVDVNLTSNSKKIKRPGFIDDNLKKKLKHHYPEILISFLEHDS